MTNRSMRLAILAASVVVLAVACNDTKQPSSSPVQTAEISFTAFGQMDTYSCWELWADQDGDGTPEDIFQMLCEQNFHEGNPIQAQVPVPWNYSIAITVIRAGHTEEQLVATSLIPGDAIEDFGNLTPYDTHQDVGGTKAPDDTFHYVTPGSTDIRQGAAAVVSNGNRLWLEASRLPQEGQPAGPFFLGDPNVMGLTSPPSFRVDLNQGDTVIVRARKQLLTSMPPYIPADASTSIELNGILVIGGVSVPLQGEPSTPGTDGTGVTFSYTRR